MEQFSAVMGWIGSTLLMVSALPQLFRVWKTRSVEDLSLSFLLMWAIGMGCMILHVAFPQIKSVPLLMNNVVSFSVCLSLLFSYYWLTRKK